MEIYYSALRPPPQINTRAGAPGSLPHGTTRESHELTPLPCRRKHQRPRDMEPGENPGQLALLYPVTMSQYANLKTWWFPFEPTEGG